MRHGRDMSTMPVERAASSSHHTGSAVMDTYASWTASSFRPAVGMVISRK